MAQRNPITNILLLVFGLGLVVFAMGITIKFIVSGIPFTVGNILGWAMYGAFSALLLMVFFGVVFTIPIAIIVWNRRKNR